MRIMMLGCPGVGKGTQAQFICEQYHIPQISTGNILREMIASGSPLGNELKACLDAGKLVPDDLINKMVIERLQDNDCLGGFLLDGFPRTIPQAQALLENDVVLDYVVVLDVPESELIKRLGGRRVHLPSGRTYHVDYNPPKVHDFDDLTGESLVQRDDDKEEVVRKRFAIYEAQTKPLVDFYTSVAKKGRTSLHHVTGSAPVAEVRESIKALLGKA
jgi:adenylate kinase